MSRYMTKRNIVFLVLIGVLFAGSMFVYGRIILHLSEGPTESAGSALPPAAYASMESEGFSGFEAIYTDVSKEAYGGGNVSVSTEDGRTVIGNPVTWPIMFTMPEGWLLETVTFEDENSAKGEIYIMNAEEIRTVRISVREQSSEPMSLEGYSEIKTGALTSFMKEGEEEIIAITDLSGKDPALTLIMTVFSKDNKEKAIKIFETLSG